MNEAEKQWGKLRGGVFDHSQRYRACQWLAGCGDFFDFWGGLALGWCHPCNGLALLGIKHGDTKVARIGEGWPSVPGLIRSSLTFGGSLDGCRCRGACVREFLLLNGYGMRYDAYTLTLKRAKQVHFFVIHHLCLSLHATSQIPTNDVQLIYKPSPLIDLRSTWKSYARSERRSSSWFQ